MEKYIGLDVHQASSTFVVEFMKLIPGTKHLCFEEGTQSEWLYEILSPHAKETVVVGLGAFTGRGQKSDKLDALGLANLLRTGGVERRVFKAKSPFGRLRDLARLDAKVVDDADKGLPARSTREDQLRQTDDGRIALARQRKAKSGQSVILLGLTLSTGRHRRRTMSKLRQ